MIPKFQDYRKFKRAAALALESITCRRDALGAVRVPGSIVWIKPDKFAQFRAVQRDVALDRAEWAVNHFEEVARVEIEDAYEMLQDNGVNVERCALVALGLNYHEDRGDGLLYVPALNSRGRLAIWRAAVRDVLGRDSLAMASAR